MPRTRPPTPTLPAADFLVIGSGVAGLRAAIGLNRAGRVLVLTKGSPAEGSSIYAQGGVAVAPEEDDIALHRDDTVRAGKGLCRPEAVQVLVEEGPARVQELIRWGARFDRAGDGYALAREAAHSRHRILRAGGDATGTEMVRVLLERARSLPQIAWRDHHFTIDLLLDPHGRCVGALVLDESSGAVKQVRAKAVVLATGGAGQIYARTTNPPVATGDGIAMAYRAGALVEDMEFVQFHPTALYLPATPQLLLTEAMRGEGAVLRNIKGEVFMKRYHEMAEMAPRDIVSRAIWNEMVATSARHVYLDVTHLDPGFIRSRFPTIYATCLRYDVDITEEMVPVCPSAHFMMGGVWTDTRGATSVPGLFAAGEVACAGVHGANRLASNSLLEGLVFGARAAEAAAEYAGHLRPERGASFERDLAVGEAEDGRGDHLDMEKLLNSLRRLMWEQVGIIRSGQRLLSALTQLEKWEERLRDPCRTRRELEVRNMVTVGRLVTTAALQREHSLGAHFRSDHPEEFGSGWERHIHLQANASARAPVGGAGVTE
ncbi:MAG: L-aspartate oxidase [Nitrospirae bacterium]|nr:MAG: L-aspartate oxidase [Nitrospirota bacterium]